MPALKFWDNGYDTVIAEDEFDAVKVWEETCGQSWEEYMLETDACWQPYEHEMITLYLEDEEDAKEMAPEDAQIEKTEHGWFGVRAPVQQWIDKLGRSFFGSSEV